MLSWVLCHHTFTGPKLFLIGILWDQICFSWIFCASKFFSCDYLVGSKLFLVAISLVKDFSCGHFMGPKSCSKFHKIHLRLIVLNFSSTNFEVTNILLKGRGGSMGADVETGKKNVCVVFVTNIMATHIHLAWSLILMLIFMFNINSFYRTVVLNCIIDTFLMETTLKNPKSFFNNFTNSMIRNCKFLLVYWNRIISLFLKVLRKLIYQTYWFCCLLICRDQNSENFAHHIFTCWQQGFMC